MGHAVVSESLGLTRPSSDTMRAGIVSWLTEVGFVPDLRNKSSQVSVRLDQSVITGVSEKNSHRPAEFYAPWGGGRRKGKPTLAGLTCHSGTS